MKTAIFYYAGLWYVGDRNRIEAFPALDSVQDYIYDHLDHDYTVVAQTVNAPIIRELYLLRNHGVISTPSIMTYRVLSSDLENVDAFVGTFFRILEQQWPVSTGGQRPIQYEDFCFALAHTFLPDSPLLVNSIFCKHLMWVPAQFFKCYNDCALAFLLGCIGDPRWHVIVDEETGEQTIDFDTLPDLNVPKIKSKFSKVPVPLDLSIWFDPILFNECVAGYRKRLSVSDYFVNAILREMIRKQYPLVHLPKLLQKYSRKYLRFIAEAWLWIAECLRLKNFSEFPMPRFGFPKSVEKELAQYLITLFHPN